MLKVMCAQEGTGPMTSLAGSPRGAPFRQGLDIIEQAHRLGGAKLKLASLSGPSSGMSLYQHDWKLGRYPTYKLGDIHQFRLQSLPYQACCICVLPKTHEDCAKCNSAAAAGCIGSI